MSSKQRTKKRPRTKPCPFCGYNDVRFNIEGDEWGKIADASCNICGATAYGMGVMVGDDSDEALITSAQNSWNHRVRARSPKISTTPKKKRKG